MMRTARHASQEYDVTTRESRRAVHYRGGVSTAN
jgi:hypothetical protein